MKKLVLMFVAIAAISFASCGNKTAAPVEEAVDTAAVDTAAAAVDTAAVAVDTAAVAE